MHANYKCVPLHLFIHIYIGHTYNTWGAEHIPAFDEKVTKQNSINLNLYLINQNYSQYFWQHL
jgi:hypothetical protein